MKAQHSSHTVFDERSLHFYRDLWNLKEVGRDVQNKRFSIRNQKTRHPYIHKRGGSYAEYTNCL